MTQYVHGYDKHATARLREQANTLADKLHYDTRYSKGLKVLEVGCGVGAQTEFLLKHSPTAEFTCIDIDPYSISQCVKKFDGHLNVSFFLDDINHLSFEDNTFDHAFVCFVLEHLKSPEKAIVELSRVIKPGGSITVIEGDHGSVLMHPESSSAKALISSQVRLQADYGGDAMIGRKLYPILTAAGLVDVSVSPRQIYADASRPDLVQNFTIGTFTEMVLGIRDAVLDVGLIEQPEFERGIEGLKRAAEFDGTFSYTFFKAIGVVPN